MLVGFLVAAARPDPDAERGGLQMRHRVGDDDEARRKTRYIHRHAAAPSWAARTAATTNRSTATWSAGNTVTRSTRCSRSASQSGRTGRTPQARSTASGNFAGWAVL